MINSTLIVASFVSGMFLGARKFVYGLAGLLAIVAVTSSLPFQVGLPNLALPPVYLLGLAISGFWGLERSHPPGPKSPLPDAVKIRLERWVALTVLTIVVASSLAVARRLMSTVRPRFDGDPRDLFVFAPPGFPGEMQAAYIAIVGPLLFVLALVSLRDRHDRLVVRRAFTFGACIAVASPVAQFVALTPWVRPDHRTYEGTTITGLVGFFQDPHSYAAYLVMAIALTAGVAIGHGRAKSGKATAGYALVAAAALVVLLYTNSRGGLVATVVSLVVLALLSVSSPNMSSKARRARQAIVAMLLVTTMLAAVVLASAPARDAVYDRLVELGNPRMWEVLRTDPLDLLAGRTARLRKAWVMVQTNPIWGVGPNRFQSTPVEIAGVRPEVIAVHPHNYYVQLATEYGIPAAACFLGLIATLLTCTIGAAYRARAPLDRGVLAGVASAQLGLLTMSLVGHPLLLTEVQAVFWTVSALGVATALGGEGRPRTGNSTSRPPAL